MAEKRQVIRVISSPMNSKRWLVELSCFHQVWVTRTRRPTMKTFRCPKCAAPKSGTSVPTEGEGTDG